MRSDDAKAREVQRYAPEGHPCECGMQECDWGEYVKYEDVESRITTLAAEVERVNGENEHLTRWKDEANTVLGETLDVLRAYATEFKAGPLGARLSDVVVGDARRLRQQLATARADALREVREKVGELYHEHETVCGHCGEEGTETFYTSVLALLDATRGET